MKTEPVTVTLHQAGEIIRTMAHRESLLLLSPPGVGKSAIVQQIANDAGLTCRSLLGTQIAPEDVSGIPKIVGQRSVFCPPKILLPEPAAPFCLFLDEFPSCAQQVQKAFYTLIMERRLGEYALPPESWVVAAGNRMQDRALVRMPSSALINRIFVLHIRVDVDEWRSWAYRQQIRRDILSYITFMPESLMREVPQEAIPFSSPRAWTSLSRALDAHHHQGSLDSRTFRALCFARLSPEDAAIFSVMVEEGIEKLPPLVTYFDFPQAIPQEESKRWFVLACIRQALKKKQLPDIPRAKVNRFLLALPPEHRFVLLVDMVADWGRMGADTALLESLKEVTGL